MRHLSTIQKYALLSLVFVSGFLWHLLLPGYVILLDWTAGPVPLLSFVSVDQMMNAPVNIALFLLGSVLPGWLVQKGTLVVLGFLLLFVPLWLSVFRQFYPRLFVALFVAVNPFVYERLLAGQWRVVVGYLCIYVLIVLLLRAVPQHKHIFGTLLLCGFFSVHFLVIGCILTGVWFLWRLTFGDHRVSRTTFFLGFVRALAIFVVLSLYWIVPFVLSQGAGEANDFAARFGSAHWEAFATVGEARWGPVVNVLALHGFWLEDRAWAQDFMIASEAPGFAFGLIGLYALAIIGILVGVCKNHISWLEGCELRHGVGFVLCLFVLAVCFSLGASTSPVQGINIWLFEHVPLWNGFRDSQKWSGVMIISLALLAGMGLSFMLSFVQRTLHSLYLVIGGVMLFVPFLITPFMMFGFAAQVKTSTYPDAWYDARQALLAQESLSPCTVVFLPWHQYYPLAHNSRVLSANVSPRFFPCDVISGRNTALGDVGADLSLTGSRYDVIDALITSNDDREQNINAVVNGLHEAGVTHIVFTNDLVGQDVYRYPFLASDALEKLYEGEGIIVFKILSDVVTQGLDMR